MKNFTYTLAINKLRSLGLTNEDFAIVHHRGKNGGSPERFRDYIATREIKDVNLLTCRRLEWMLNARLSGRTETWAQLAVLAKRIM